MEIRAAFVGNASGIAIPCSDPLYNQDAQEGVNFRNALIWGLAVLSRLFAGFTFLGVLFFGVNACSQSKNDEAPFFSVHAAALYTDKVAISPNGKRQVTVEILDEKAEDFPSTVRMKDNELQLSSRINFGLNAQILWSPDSRSFAVTGSCCGAGGQYETDVFYVQRERLTKVELTSLIVRGFGHPVRCEWPEDSNVVAVKWVKPSRQLLLAAQIMNHTVCDSPGTFKAFLVDIPDRRIVKVYNQLAAKKLFSNDLGKWLLDANDDCVRDPESCRVGHFSTRKSE
ncbi:MAG TPA: hypothetical protein VEU52_05285 [Candidatus Limnocylindrales bacterium]|nr:hypothetical protein [Candidatus Limnocylindrales bacterium]